VILVKYYKMLGKEKTIGMLGTVVLDVAAVPCYSLSQTLY